MYVLRPHHRDTGLPPIGTIHSVQEPSLSIQQDVYMQEQGVEHCVASEMNLYISWRIWTSILILSLSFSFSRHLSILAVYIKSENSFHL